MQKLRLQLNPRTTIEIESTDTKDLIKRAAMWSAVPEACPLCGAEIIFTYRTPQSFEFFGLRCLGQTPHSVNFGEYKDASKGMYYKNDWGTDQGGSAQAEEGEPQRGPAVTDIKDPVAKSLADMVTTKQLGMIRAVARNGNVDADAVCSETFACKVSELNRRAASALIDKLRESAPDTQAQNQPSPHDRQVGEDPPIQAPNPVQPAAAAKPVADDDIPF